MKRTTVVNPGHVLSIIERGRIEIFEHTIIALLSKFIKTYLDQREPSREPPERVEEKKSIKRKEREKKRDESKSPSFYTLFLVM